MKNVYKLFQVCHYSIRAIPQSQAGIIILNKCFQKLAQTFLRVLYLGTNLFQIVQTC